jgi:hypothetical protein
VACHEGHAVKRAPRKPRPYKPRLDADGNTVKRPYKPRLDADGNTVKRPYKPRLDADGERVKVDRSIFTNGHFVAVDGEGFSEGKPLIVRIEDNEYVYSPHYYGLIASSDGHEDYVLDGRLRIKTCLDFLLNIVIRDRRAIPVIFSGSYDVVQFLAHDLSREQCKLLLQSTGTRSIHLDITLGEHDYRLKMVPRKSFTVSRWNAGEDKYKINKRGEWQATKHISVTLWDVWGFFQDSFIGVMEKWIPGNADYQFIAGMKGKRKLFQREEMEVIRKYTQAELRCLVEVMNELRKAIAGLGLKITRWDGAGAIAGAMMKTHQVKLRKSPDYTPAFDAACHAYSGGHIEVYKLGYHKGDVHHYDINSAYPAEFIGLPDLSSGRWQHSSDSDNVGSPPDGFTLVRVAYNFNEGMPFYPLFFRERDGTILYPSEGEGWYWFPEYDVAREFFYTHGGVAFRVLEWWHYRHSGLCPFSWVQDYYDRRKLLVAISKRTKVPNGEEKIIKLGLNSLYGKTMQTVGARVVGDDIVPPSYFQIEWGGYVTSGCRSKLMRAAIQQPHAIIAIATDGIFSLEPLLLDCPKDKLLGGWEYQKHDGITMVMPGVYWLHDLEEETGELKSKHYTRGFNKETMEQPSIIHEAWKRRERYIAIETTRMIGLGTACTSPRFWKMRGCFVTSQRELSLDGHNSKRYPVSLSTNRPARGLVQTWPLSRDRPDITMSKAYDVRFLMSPIEDVKKRAEDEGEREAIDAEHPYI